MLKDIKQTYVSTLTLFVLWPHSPEPNPSWLGQESRFPTPDLTKASHLYHWLGLRRLFPHFFRYIMGEIGL